MSRETKTDLGSRPSASTQAAADQFIKASIASRYSYGFNWLGRPVIQYPQDIVAMQEIIWSVRPDVIVETGIAHGGSLIFSAAMLELNAACGGNPHARVIGIDIDIRAHNRTAVEAHPMSKRISMIEGSSVSPEIVDEVHRLVRGRQNVLVCLDSNHTHHHVVAELDAYAGLVSVGSYCVVFDTVIEHLPVGSFPDRPWDKGDNPKTAVHTWIKGHPEFEIDQEINDRLLISAAPDGYLKRVA